MPRTNLPKGQPSFISRGHVLSDEAKATLFQLLGTSPDPLIIGKIQAALGIFVDGAQHIDNPPRPTDYVRAFGSIEHKARELSEELFELNYHYDAQLSHGGVDPNGIAAALLKLAEESRKAREQFEGQSSKGAPHNTALLETIRHLKVVFRGSYRGPVAERKKRGPFSPISDWEARRERFIKVALLDAHCIPQSYTVAKLRRLIRDPRCTLPQERPERAEAGALAEEVAEKKLSARRQKGNNR